MPAKAGISGGGAQQFGMALSQAYLTIACDPSLRWGDG
jgi:hypothetical protein